MPHIHETATVTSKGQIILSKPTSQVKFSKRQLFGNSG